MQTQYITDQNGNRISVVLPIEQYEQLLADLHDLAIVAERRQEPLIALEVLKDKLGIEHEV